MSFGSRTDMLYYKCRCYHHLTLFCICCNINCVCFHTGLILYMLVASDENAAANNAANTLVLLAIVLETLLAIA